MISSLMSSLISTIIGGLVTFWVSYHYFKKSSEEFISNSKELIQKMRKLKWFINLMCRAMEEKEPGTFNWDKKKIEPTGLILNAEVRVEANSQMTANVTVTRNCKNCGKKFEKGSTNNKDFCSDDCNFEYYKEQLGEE